MSTNHSTNRLLRTAWLVAVLAGCETHAKAHLVTTGLGPVYDGLTHFVCSPWDVAIILALAAVAAMRGARCGRSLLVWLPAGFLAGGFAGLSFHLAAAPSWYCGACLLLVGVLIAADRELPLPLIIAIAVSVGALAGLISGSAYQSAPSGWLSLLGAGTAMLMLATLAGGLVVSLRAKAARIAVRALGSWGAAIGLLTLGWALRSR